MFVFDKKSLDSHGASLGRSGASSLKRATEEVVERLKKEASSLVRTLRFVLKTGTLKGNLKFTQIASLGNLRSEVWACFGTTLSSEVYPKKPYSKARKRRTDSGLYRNFKGRLGSIFGLREVMLQLRNLMLIQCHSRPGYGIQIYSNLSNLWKTHEMAACNLLRSWSPPLYPACYKKKTNKKEPAELVEDPAAM